MYNRFAFNPVRAFEHLSRKMNELSSDLDKTYTFEIGGYMPRVDISEDEKYIYLNAELAGVKKEDVKVTVNDDNLLIIKGEKKRITDSDEKKDQKYMRTERLFGEFTRSFTLPQNVKKDSINARYDSGVLEISLEKVEPEKPKEVEVTIH